MDPSDPRSGYARFSRVLFGLAVLQLGGCAVEEPPDRAAVLAEALPPKARVPTDWSSQEANTAAVSQDWVASFKDPILTSLVAEAMANNPDLKVAAARVDAASEALVIAGAPLYPSVSLGAGADRTWNGDEGDSASRTGGDLAVVWELDIWGRVRSERAASRAEFQAAAEADAFARLSLAALVARSWYVNSELLQLIELGRKEVALYSNLLDLVREQEAAGRVGLLDVYQSQASLAGAEAALVKAEERSSESIRSLEILLGRYPGNELEARNRFVAPPPQPPAGLPASLLSRRPDVLAAERQVEAAFYDVKVAELSLLPSFDLTASAGRLVDLSLGLLGLTPNFLQIGANLLQPVFEGGALRAEIQAASAEQRAAVAAYGQAAIVAFKEVETTLANESYFRSRLQYLQDELESWTATVTLATARYDAGNFDLQNLLQFQERQILAEAEVIQAEAGILTNRVDLFLALGGDF